MALATAPEAVEDFKAGKCVIVVDDEDRENEGDLVVAAEKVTPDQVSFMTHHGSGLVCLPIKARRLDELGIAPMVERNTSRLGTAFSVSIDARDTTPTGASAHDRADRKSTRLNSSHSQISYAVFCLKKKKKKLHIAVVLVDDL